MLFSRKPASRAVFLDRDGVINRPVFRDGKAASPRTVEEFDILGDVRKACSLLTGAGFLLVVVTNQPDVGRGLMSREELNSMHHILCRLLPIRRVEVSCDADDSPLALRRKPNPGMLFDAAAELGIDLSRSYMIGDTWRDIECGRRAGCRTIHIERGHHEKLRTIPDFRGRDLLDAARTIVDENRVEKREIAVWQPVLLR